MVTVLARSRAGLFPCRAAFSALAPDRHPHYCFRGLLKLHTRYGPPDCSPTMCGLCHEVSISPVFRTHRSPAIESNHQLFEWVLPPLVFSPFGAHAKAPVRYEASCARLWRLALCVVEWQAKSERGQPIKISLDIPEALV
jgi:hypothetical protein